MIFVLVFLDQSTKWLAQTKLIFFQSVTIIPKIFTFDLVHNYGAAYGILQNQRLFLLSVTAIVIFGGIFFSKTIIQSKWSYYGLIFLLAGAIGNGIDRLFLGYVIDFINIKIFPVFNFADIFIDIAVGCFIMDIIVNGKKTTNN
ncbi:signal peptidase II [bacterium]|nr:signal peptidase II [bacterium]|tara:strand:- start:1931 stop:2362 length:432 start_codon:yes stop_codon:yes gene_type:complete